jgi:hypothetical protein
MLMRPASKIPDTSDRSHGVLVMTSTWLGHPRLNQKQPALDKPRVLAVHRLDFGALPASLVISLPTTWFLKIESLSIDSTDVTTWWYLQ